MMNEITGGGLTSSGYANDRARHQALLNELEAAVRDRVIVETVQVYPLLPPLLYGYDLTLSVNGERYHVGHGCGFSRRHARSVGERRGREQTIEIQRLLADTVAGSQQRLAERYGPALEDPDRAPTWDSRPEDAPGQAFVGLDDDGQDLVLASYRCDRDGRTRVHHALVTGPTSAARDTFASLMVMPGLRAGTEMVFNLVGHNESCWRFGDRVTVSHTRPKDPQSGQRHEQLIALAWAVMWTRQRRGWTGPSASDPVITLVISEGAAVQDSIGTTFQSYFAEITRMGPTSGVRIIQELTSPALPEVLGGTTFRAACHYTAAFASGSRLHPELVDADGARISLSHLTRDQAVVMEQGHLRARQAQIAPLTPADVDRDLQGVEPAQLHPEDAAAVDELLDVISLWAAEDAAGISEQQ